jgi:hypothetical protein
MSGLSLLSLCIIGLNYLPAMVRFSALKIKENNDKEISDMFKDIEHIKDPYKTQMQKAIDKIMIRVAVYDDNAYWISNNVLYRASVDSNGDIHNEEASEVDVFSMSDKEVKKLLNIIDSISN